jgi:hypothetical protein
MDASRARPLWLALRLPWFRRDRQKVEDERKGCAANRLLAELRHLLDSACLSFLGMLPTFTGFSHGVNESSEAKKASILPAVFSFVLLNFEAQAKCNQLQHRLTTDLDAVARMD